MKQPVLGFAMCGSFCTYQPVLEALEELHTVFPDIIPIMSDVSFETDSRFGPAESFRARLETIAVMKSCTQFRRSSQSVPRRYSTRSSLPPAPETQSQSLQTALPTRPLPLPPKPIFEMKRPSSSPSPPTTRLPEMPQTSACSSTASTITLFLSGRTVPRKSPAPWSPTSPNSPTPSATPCRASKFSRFSSEYIAAPAARSILRRAFSVRYLRIRPTQS